MADSFRKLDTLPPLRLAVQDVAQIADELAKQAASGGNVEVELRVGFEDGTTFTRDSTQAFLANLDPEGEPIEQIEIGVTGWKAAGDAGIARSIRVQLRRFGSQFYVSSDDSVWGLGAVGAIKRRFARHTPRYAPLLRWAPPIIGGMAVFAATAIIVAIAHEQGVTPLLVSVVALSLLLLATLIWAAHQDIHSRGVFAHTLIRRQAATRDWLWLKVLAAGVALGADAATLVVLLAR